MSYRRAPAIFPQASKVFHVEHFPKLQRVFHVEHFFKFCVVFHVEHFRSSSEMSSAVVIKMVSAS